jgi:hypothetical protein
MLAYCSLVYSDIHMHVIYLLLKNVHKLYTCNLVKLCSRALVT